MWNVRSLYDLELLLGDYVAFGMISIFFNLLLVIFQNSTNNPLSQWQSNVNFSAFGMNNYNIASKRAIGLQLKSNISWSFFTEHEISNKFATAETFFEN